MSKTTTIVILVVTFAVVALVAYMFISSNKDTTTTKTTTSDGLGNILGSVSNGLIGGIFGAVKSTPGTSKPAQSSTPPPGVLSDMMLGFNPFGV